MRVLIVDDSIVMRMLVEQALRQAGLDLDEVLQAANGMEGLTALETAERAGAPLDLIFSDLHMPVMDGLEFLHEKRRRGLAADVPVMMITAEGCDSQILKAIAAGAQGFISKPFTFAQVQTNVAALLTGTA